MQGVLGVLGVRGVPCISGVPGCTWVYLGLPGCTACVVCTGCTGCTWAEQPPAVLLVCGTLAIVAVALGLVVAGFAVHVEAVVRTEL